MSGSGACRNKTGPLHKLNEASGARTNLHLFWPRRRQPQPPSLRPQPLGLSREAHVGGSQGEGPALPGLKREGRGKARISHPASRRRGGSIGSRPRKQCLGLCASLRSGAGRMLGRRGARAERGMPRGWTALCLLSLLREYRLRARPAGLGGEEGRRSPRGRARSQLHTGKGPLPQPTPPRLWLLQALVGRGLCELIPAGPSASPVKSVGWGRKGRRPRRE